MDADGHIYLAEDGPPEDRARLQGYLRGRADAELLARLREQLAKAGHEHEEIADG